MSETEKKPHHEIGSRLKVIREATGLNTKQYTRLMGLGYTRYINWETGVRRLQPEEAEMFCDKFSVSLDFIYRGKLDALPEKILKLLSSIPRDSDQSTSSDNPEASAS